MWHNVKSTLPRTMPCGVFSIHSHIQLPRIDFLQAKWNRPMREFKVRGVVFDLKWFFCFVFEMVYSYDWVVIGELDRQLSAKCPWLSDAVFPVENQYELAVQFFVYFRWASSNTFVNFFFLDQTIWALKHKLTWHYC